MFKLNKILLVSFFAFFISSCAMLTQDLLKDPEVSIANFEMTNITLKDISINLKLNIKNPNPIPLNLGKVNYALNFSGKKVTEGVFDKGIDIPATGNGEVVIPLKFEYNAIGSLLDGFIKKTITKDYELNGTAQFGIFSIPFNKKGEIQLDKK